MALMACAPWLHVTKEVCSEMTRREQVLEALERREPDRVPLDFGSTGTTGIGIPTHEKLNPCLDADAEMICIDGM